MRLRIVVVGAILAPIFLSSVAFGQQSCANGCAVTLSAAAATIVLPQATNLLAIDNEAASGGNAIACRFDGSAAALNTAGSWTIPAQFTRVWQGQAIPPQTGSVSCIAAGSTPVTFQVK